MSLPIPRKPGAYSPFRLSSGPFTCVLPNLFDSGAEERGVRTFFNLPDGADQALRIRDASFEPIRLELGGYIYSEVTVRDLRRVIGRKTLVVERDGKTLPADVTEFSIKEVEPGKMWAVTLAVASPNGYWLGALRTSPPDPVVVYNNGDIETRPAIRWVGGIGGAQRVSVYINGRGATYDGSVAWTDVLLVDTADLTATLNGQPVLNSMNASFFTNPPRLDPGKNLVSFGVTGSAVFTIEHRERYL